MRRLALWVPIFGTVAVVAMLLRYVAEPTEEAGHAHSSGRGLVRIDPSTNGVVGWLPLEGLSGLAVDGDATWVTRGEDRFSTVVDIDARSNALGSAIRLAPLVVATPRSIVASEQAVWAIAGDRVYRIDLATTDVLAKTPKGASGSSLASLAVGAGAVWVTDPTKQVLYRIDPRVNEAIARIPVPHAAGVAVGSGSVWVTNSVDGRVFRVDPSRGRITGAFPAPGASYGIAVGAGGIWVADTAGDRLQWIDPVSGIRHPVPVGRGPTDVAVSGHVVWVTNSEEGTVTALDADSRTVTATIEVGARPYLVEATRMAVWVALLGTFQPHHHGH